MSIDMWMVERNPDKYSLRLTDNALKRSWVLTLTDKITGERLNWEVPEQAYFAPIMAALWIKSENAIVGTDEAISEVAYLQAKLDRYALRLSEKSSRIYELEKHLKELQAQVKPPNALVEEEYAYVEGWDEF